MPSKGGALRFLLDEHYPPWLADAVTEDGWDSVAVVADSRLRGADDIQVLRFAAQERRVVVTEDVTTFTAAIAAVPHHVGVIYCHHARFPRTRRGLSRLRVALTDLARDPPAGLGTEPIVHWLGER